jgi:Tfp pilus assembly PilM family ATPase
MTLTLTPPHTPEELRERRAARPSADAPVSLPSPALRGAGLRLPSGAGLIGVDVTDRWLCVAQLVGRGQGAPSQLLVGARFARRAEGNLTEDEARWIMGTIERAGFRGRRVVLGAPERALTCTPLELPPRSSKAPVEQIARMEVARIHRREPSSFEMALWDVPAPERAKGASHAMAATIATDACEPNLRALEDAGLEVVAMDARACALARAACAGAPSVPGLVGVLEVAWNGANVVLVHLGGDGHPCVVYERRIEECALRDLVQALVERVGLSRACAEAALCASTDSPDADDSIEHVLRMVRRHQGEFIERLAPEVHRSFVYASQRYPSLQMGTLLLTGEGGNVRGLRERVASVMGVECALLRGRDILAGADGSLWASGAMVACVGLGAFDRRRAPGGWSLRNPLRAEH